MKGQAAIVDALFFMLICSGASTLLFYTSGLYGSNTNKQIITIYNYEYAGTALVSLHYTKDRNKEWFWNRLKEKLAKGEDIPLYLDSYASNVWDALSGSSPTKDIFLCFSGTSSFCYNPDYSNVIPPEFDKRTVCTSSVSLIDDNEDTWEISLKLYY